LAIKAASPVSFAERSTLSMTSNNTIEPIGQAKTRQLMKSIIDPVNKNMETIEEQRYNIEMKADGSPVTASDLLLESIIREHLEEELHGITFAGEESFIAIAGNGTKGYHAILDPIDRTENFCSGLKEWGISFTLWHDGKNLWSLLFMPELNE
jgi:myo-inositol-1(or 4)-monophosphatase